MARYMPISLVKCCGQWDRIQLKLKWRNVAFTRILVSLVSSVLLLPVIHVILNNAKHWGAHIIVASLILLMSLYSERMVLVCCLWFCKYYWAINFGFENSVNEVSRCIVKYHSAIAPEFRYWWSEFLETGWPHAGHVIGCQVMQPLVFGLVKICVIIVEYCIGTGFFNAMVEF